jgi:hypothetical protein
MYNIGELNQNRTTFIGIIFILILARWSNTKSMYRSNSCIESCESGVVGDIEDNRESNM